LKSLEVVMFFKTAMHLYRLLHILVFYYTSVLAYVQARTEV